MLETLQHYDSKLFIWLNSLGSTTWDGLWLFITNKLSSIPLYALLLYLVFKKFGLKGTLITVVCIALMITCTDQLANLFKHGFERPRPCRVPELQEIIRIVAKRCGRYGYFSAHAASSMAAAVFAGLALRSKYRNLIFLLLFWAAIIGYSRIYVGVHYPGDVLTGMIIGSLLGLSFYKLQHYLISRFDTQ